MWRGNRREMQERLEQLRRISAEAEAGGGTERREREHKAGKLSARERIHFCWTKGHSKSWTNLCGIGAWILARKRTGLRAMAL